MSQSTAPAFGEERRQLILEIVRAEGKARVRELAARIGVTEATIRKDIIELDRSRLVRRIHGGALALADAYEPALADRVDTNLSAKRAIARACLELIHDGDAIFLDGGTTTGVIAESLAANPALLAGAPVPRNVNVLTNSMMVATALASVANVRHTVLGGQYRPLGGTFVGSLAVQALEAFTLNIAFIGVTGITEDGITAADLADTQVKRAAIERSRRVVVPLDASKVGVVDFIRVVDLASVNTVVTDEPTATLERICKAHGVELIVAVR